MAHPNRLLNTTILVFGGTSGIGFGVANMALSTGATVIISGSRQPKIDEKVALLRSFYPSLADGKISGHALDLFDTAGLESGNLKAFFDKVTNGGQNKIDHIAFTAGDAFGKLPTVETINTEDAINGLRVRWLAPAFIAKVLATNPDVYMERTLRSSFTITGGTNTQKPLPGWSLGASWGGAVEGLSRGLAVDLKPIRVNMVEPGAVQTELLKGYLDAIGEQGVKDLKKGGSLTGELGLPEDLAETYAWFMKDWFATGVVASSNGGRMLV